jgi:hypothetical protein
MVGSIRPNPNTAQRRMTIAAANSLVG